MPTYDVMQNQNFNCIFCTIHALVPRINLVTDTKFQFALKTATVLYTLSCII